ncbi:CDP-alcohol phosphatidyltransferase family protein [Pararhodobacter zhoushanensis]|uniref:CDP-alcohol phosphatidyltransferase family protein n=1 Tax=Pararhodobacter zhoushanensis TaxID=2479545 RepID=A0ABT3H2Y9_9RHOB|nr:CDP-alcohol phosphatidyltransferase family protein [Pararhodobacter zhoushanensis]MCW1934147.1 CDP-alcohol phosphatidyltransferase family protein [Pararhodobacter zhoushanensis]
MLDRHLRPLIDPPLNRIGVWLARAGFGADLVTLIGLVFGLAAAVAIGAGQVWWGLGLILASRLADGLDGAVARATQPSDRGGYFDILADFGFYAAIPLGFVWLEPAANGLAGAALLGAFYINAASFLGFAILAAKHNLSTEARGKKSWYHAGGLLEGSETIAFFVAFCLFPAAFVPIAWVFAALCLVTALARVAAAAAQFRDQG